MRMVNGKKICIAGGIATGKSTTAKLISKKFGLKIISFSDILKEQYVLKFNTKPDRRCLQKYGNNLIQKLGYSGFFHWLIEKDKNFNTCETLIVEGFRRFEFYKIFKDNFKNSILLYHTCSSKTQIDRIMIRDNLKLENIKNILKHNSENSSELFLEHADLIINTDKNNNYWSFIKSFINK